MFLHCSVKLLKKNSTTNEFQKYDSKTGSTLISENEYENVKTNDFLETTGFSNPAIAESVSHNSKYKTAIIFKTIQLFKSTEGLFLGV